MARLQKRRPIQVQAGKTKKQDADKLSNVITASTSAVPSNHGTLARFARPVLIKSHTDSIVPKLAEGSPVIIAIRDEWDKVSQGMLFRLSASTPLKHAFEAFRTRSCKICRDKEKMMFVCTGRVVGDEDTPKRVCAISND